MNSILKGIEKSKEQNFEITLSSLGFTEITKNIVKILIKNQYNSVEKISNLVTKQNCIEILTSMNGIGISSAKSIVSNFTNDKNIKLLKTLKVLGLKLEEEESSASNEEMSYFENQTWVVTGTFINFEPRQKMIDIIEKFGGKVTKSISSKITYLVAGTKAGSKLQKAKDLNIKILEERDFLQLLQSLISNTSLILMIFFQKLLFYLLVIFVTLLISNYIISTLDREEIIVNNYDSKYIYSFYPNKTAVQISTEYKSDVYIDSSALKNCENNLDKKHPAQIWILGNYFSEGIGVDCEKSFPFMIKGFNIFNGGFYKGSLPHYILKNRDYIQAVKPNSMIIQVSDYDITASINALRFVKVKKNGEVIDLKDSIFLLKFFLKKEYKNNQYLEIYQGLLIFLITITI